MGTIQLWWGQQQGNASGEKTHVPFPQSKAPSASEAQDLTVHPGWKTQSGIALRSLHPPLKNATLVAKCFLIQVPAEPLQQQASPRPMISFLHPKSTCHKESLLTQEIPASYWHPTQNPWDWGTAGAKWSLWCGTVLWWKKSTLPFRLPGEPRAVLRQQGAYWIQETSITLRSYRLWHCIKAQIFYFQKTKTKPKTSIQEHLILVSISLGTTNVCSLRFGTGEAGRMLRSLGNQKSIQVAKPSISHLSSDLNSSATHALRGLLLE